jgi:hypothetical protein
MQLKTIKPEEINADKDTPRTVAEQDEAFAIVDKYIMGEPIEKTIMIKKIKVVLRAPSVGIVNDIYRDVAKAAQDSYVNMQVESSASMLSAYVREYNGKDYLAELGDEYDTTEGKKKIRQHLDSVLIEPVRDALTERMFKFYDDIKKAFTDESLDFS